MLATELLYRHFGSAPLSERKEREAEIGGVHPSTLGLWVIPERLREARPKGTLHEGAKSSGPTFGEITLTDTSRHPWIEARGGEEILLIALIDNATNELLRRFFPQDTGAANRTLSSEDLERYARMGAASIDGAGHFRINSRIRPQREDDLDERLRLIHRPHNALDIEFMIALSPQVKARVERRFGTRQDRLMKGVQLAGISCMEEAHKFLRETFGSFWNGRSTVGVTARSMHAGPLPPIWIRCGRSPKPRSG